MAFTREDRELLQRLETKIDRIDTKLDRLNEITDKIGSDIQAQYKEQAKGFFVLKSQQDRMLNRMNDIQKSLASISDLVKSSSAQMNTMSSDFKGALRHLGVEQEADRFGRKRFTGHENSSIDSLENFTANVCFRMTPVTQGSLVENKSDVYRNSPLVSPAQKLTLDDLKDRIQSLPENHRKNLEKERDDYVELVTHSATLKLAAECRKLAELQKGPVESPDICEIHHELTQDLRKYGWGDRAEKIATNALIRLEEGQERFNQYARPSLEEKLSTLVDQLEKDGQDASLPKTGFFASISEMGIFKPKPDIEMEKGSMKSLFTARNLASVVRTTMGAVVDKAIGDLSLTEFRDSIQGKLNEIHDYQSANQALSNYVSKHPDHEFGPDDELNSHMSKIGMQLDTTGDSAREVSNRAFAIAVEKVNAKYYDHGDRPVEYSKEEVAEAERVIEVSAVMGNPMAMAYLEGDFKIDHDASKSIVNRLNRDNTLQMLTSPERGRQYNGPSVH